MEIFYICRWGIVILPLNPETLTTAWQVISTFRVPLRQMDLQRWGFYQLFVITNRLFHYFKAPFLKERERKKGWNTPSHYVKWGYLLKVLKCTYWNHHFEVKRGIILLELESNCWVKPSWQLHLILKKLASATTEIQVFFIIAGERPANWHILLFNTHAALDFIFFFKSGIKIQ